ncbi:MAG TPA: Crp/Fnr family transcriptional regulator [Terriglobia bacterium]|nr:Crp/Fnr family transcriptional regulator [Terriglobia bacterium]
MNGMSVLETSESCRDCKNRLPGSFCDVSAQVRAAMDGIGFSASYPKGSVLFTEGDTPRGVMVLCRGRVKVFMTSSEGRTLILRVAKPGEMLGLCGVISNRPRQATAETVEPCRVTFFRREDFLRLLRDHGELSLRAAQQLSVSYATACEQARSIGLSGSAPKKLARFLLDWTADGSRTAPNGRTMLTLTHEEIGQMISASRETVTRTLGEFKSQRLVNLRGSVLSIPNRTALEHLIDL